MLADADLHIHSRYSKAVSKSMTIPNLASHARFKGLKLVGTGDILNSMWERELLESTEKVDEGTYERNGIRFLLTAEVEDNRRVHHVLIFPSIETVREIREVLKAHSPDIETEGRPHINLSAAEIADMVNEMGVLIGPAHAFTPWTSLYKEYNNLKEAYNGAKIHFLELGLSADSEMADMIKAHHRLTYLSNSDAHSPMPHRLGREFNRFEVEEPTFEEIRKAILKRGGRRIVLNAGLDPRLGKYHLTACSRCYAKYSPREARVFNWKCPKCGGRIKKGVRDRILELADTDERPKDRPPYIRLAPLAEIISMVIGKGVETKAVKRVWELFLREFGSEIGVLVDVPVEALAKINEDVAKAVWAYRTGSLIVIPGGGGKYGEIRLPDEIRGAEISELETLEVEVVEEEYRPSQTTLLEFIK
ncbi:TIGR00375 family protein [Thermococcus sp.]